MRLVTGYICLACFILLAVKYPLRKLGLHKVNAALMKIHEHASGLLFIAAIVHIVLVFPVALEKGPALPIFGGVSFALLFWLVAACHMMKDVKKRMVWHRWLSLVSCLAIIAHVAVYWLVRK